ncbi:hypothetical protein HPB47_004594 [Ixodes persulcatus]|uniref:Uncharacterized protein n=1 Tax=Ixodes persulcatus TaxID=34615 RepID=A0AC60PFC2_IXOPE|nr:hypothetical protein HPB47_004594 [Ixodes persulcatus]
MGAALHNVVEKKAQGELLGGRGKLTQEKIKKITNYYGYALRSNSHYVPGMKRATSKNANVFLDSVKKAADEAVAVYHQGRRATNESNAAGLGYATGHCLVRRSIEKDSSRLRKANVVHQSSSSMKERFSKQHQAGASHDYSPRQL